MPHFKCTVCKTRLHSPAIPDDSVGHLCPGCGSLLEPVSDLSEIVGFQAITAGDQAGDGGAPERWLDDGGSLDLEAMAKALAPPTKETF
jgi:hypothetical protein